jgi:hypothetical protein
MELGEGKLYDCIPCARKKQVEHFDGVMHEQPVELIGNREYYVEVGNRQQIPFAVFYPCFTLCVLTPGTMTITTGVIADANVPAFLAPVYMSPQGCCAATLQSV